MINRRYLNFKTYDAFRLNLEAGEINQDSIVFIQDRLCIWAHGKEYICDGPYTANTENNSLKFKNGNDTVIFSVDVDTDTITFTDSEGNTTSITLALKSEIQDVIQFVNAINSELTGRIDSVQDQHDHDVEFIQDKVNRNYADTLNLLTKKQDKLIAGYGINISPFNVISYTLDESLYIIVNELPDLTVASPNKIYILEKLNSEGQYIHEEWRVINGEWTPIGVSVPEVDYKSYLNNVLNDYTTYDFIETNYQPKGNYATKEYVDETFVKWSQVYLPRLYSNDDDDQLGSSTNVNTGTIDIAIDGSLSLSSSNPVANWVITRALNTKANIEDLERYATKLSLHDLESSISSSLSSKADKSELDNLPTFADLETKQDILTAGRGIAIENNVISSTLDNSVYLIVDELPTENIDDNKIYILDTVDGNEHTYILYSYKNNEWVPIGSVAPEVDLTAYLRIDSALLTYLSKQDASRLYLPVGDYQPAGNYLPAGNYATVDNVHDNYQPKGDYIDLETFDAFILNVNNTFQRRGGYALASDVSNALTLLQQMIDQKYVLKRDVYNPANAEYSTSEPVLINIGTSNGDNSGSGSTSGGGSSNMVTLTVDQYAGLVRANLVDENTYYFTYEAETLTEWHFGGTFPITLTDGSTPDSIGTFPINLT